MIRLFCLLILLSSYSIAQANDQSKDDFSPVEVETAQSTEKDITAEASYFMNNGSLQMESKENDNSGPIKLNIDKEDLNEIFSHNGDALKPVIKLEVSNFDPKSLSLHDIIYEAIDRNLDLKIAEKDSMVAKWGFWQEFSNALPDVTANIGIQNLDGTFYFFNSLRGSVDETQRYANLRGDWRAFDGGKTALLILAEKYIKKSADQNKLNQFNLTILNSIELYNALLLTQSSLASRNKAFEEAKTNLNLTKSYYEIGTGTYYEFLQAKARFASAKQSLITQKSQFRKAQISLARFLNIDLEEQFFIEKIAVEQFQIIDPEMSFDSFKSISKENNPLLKQALYNEKAARRTNYASYGDYLPKLDLFAQMSALGSGFNDLNNVTTIGGELTIDFGDGLGLFSVSENLITKNQLDKSKLTRRNTELMVESELRNSYLDYETAESNIVQARELLKASEEALRLSRMRYENGIEIINDLVQNETALSNAEVNMISSITEFNNAQAKLAYLMGDIDITKILQNKSELETRF